jgi:hypothetical protein
MQCVREGGGGGYGIIGGDGASDRHLLKSLFTGIFYMTTFCIAFYESFLSTHQGGQGTRGKAAWPLLLFEHSKPLFVFFSYSITVSSLEQKSV